VGYFRHPQALVDTDDVGEGTRVWAFAHVMSGAKVGRHCNIGEHCFIEEGAVIGDHVTVKNYVAVWRGVTIEDNAFIGPHATLTNDLRPRSRPSDWTLAQTRIGRGSTIGANATIVCGIEIGAFAFVGAGSVVTSSIADYRLVYGNPARAHGYVCGCAEPLTLTDDSARCASCGSRFRLDPRLGLVAEH
jgi:acetyltransferase-like isoleucine patch superfamily enzyme